MDTLFPHGAVAAIRGSLDAAGFPGFTISPALGFRKWFDLDWLHDFARTLEHRELPIRWQDRELPPYDCLEVTRKGWVRPIGRIDRHGIVVVRGEVVVACFHLMNADTYTDDLILVGERRAGALQEFMDQYCAYALDRTRKDPVVWVVGGEAEERPRGLGWDDLVLPSCLRDEVRAQVEGFFRHREAYRRLGISHRRGFLLAGPPGNGKTSILRVVASRLAEPFILFRGKERDDRSHLDEAFDFASGCAPSILVFEDVDTIFKDEGILSHFLNRLDGLSTLDGVMVLATTNHPEELDAALTDRPSRFDRVWVLPNPEAPERREYLRRTFGDAFDEALVRQTDGFSFAHLKEVWVSACLDAIEAGREAPTTSAAHRAIERVQGHRHSVEQGFETKTRPVGFRRAGSG